MAVAPWASPLVPKTGGQVSSASYRLTACVVLWYVVSLAGIILNKHLLSAPEGSSAPRVEPMALALVQTVSTVLLGALSQARMGCSRRGRLQRPASCGDAGSTGRPRGMVASALLGLGFLRFLVTTLGLVSLRHVAASFTETVKASSPFFTVAAALALSGEWTPLPQILALVPVVGGLMVASAAEVSFTLIGFGAALSTNCVECVQNVVCKRLLQPSRAADGARSPCTPAQLQYYSATASLVVQLPLFAGALLNGALSLPSDASVLYLLCLNGCVYYTQSALVFEVMSQCSPVSVSVLNTAKRALIICFSAAYFGNSFTLMAKFGTAMTLAGGCLYSVVRVNSGSGELPKEEHLERFRGQLAPASQRARGPEIARWTQQRKHPLRKLGLCSEQQRGRRRLAVLAAMLSGLWPGLLPTGSAAGSPAPRHLPRSSLFQRQCIVVLRGRRFGR